MRISDWSSDVCSSDLDDMAIPKTKSSTASSQKSNAATSRARKHIRSRYSRAEMEEIFRRFSVQRPEPKGELEHSNPFTLVVAVALSAQATDAGVNKATRGLFKVADTPEKMLALGEDGVIQHIKTIGLYRRSEEQTSELQSLMRISNAFCFL